MTVELALHTLLDALAVVGCHTPHAIFAGGARYVPPSATARVSAETTVELAAAGLVAGTRLTPEFEDVLHVLGRPHTEYFAHVRAGGEQHHSLVAARGRSVVVAVRTGERVRLDTATTRDLPGLLVRGLPPSDAAMFEPFLVHNRRSGENPDSLDGTGDLRRLLSLPERGIGYLHVARRPGRGTRVEADGTVYYLDADLGRVGLHRECGHVTVFPGRPDLLAARVAALRATLA
ncbi:ESX secretion-associated protein EspG [Saccharomonospora xinjiangensis]|uniref:ESX secretion-associated protein EspG n=1 Tax=Saccharomonospora xinjiangensis TaxID=75294 RepID=UPI0035104853